MLDCSLPDLPRRSEPVKYMEVRVKRFHLMVFHLFSWLLALASPVYMVQLEERISVPVVPGLKSRPVGRGEKHLSQR